MRQYSTKSLTALHSIKACLMVLCITICIDVFGQSLPSPPANLQTLPVGSYVIPMDNTYQLNNGGDFNIKTYGMIIHLLNNNIKVKWVIKAGKAKDGIDFTASTYQVKPTIVTGSISRNFKGGPFVIYAADTAGVSALVNSFYTTHSIAGNNRPKIFHTDAGVTVDIRYDLTGLKPKAAILNDGGNEGIHEDFMVAASVPVESYSISFGKDLITGCYTFASEPHNDRSGLIVDSAIIGIKNFVTNGGNFLAQCAAVTNYENSNHGRFQSTTGITASYVNIGSSITYANPDLSFTQFEGDFDGQNGVVEAWTINAAGMNNQHNHASGSGANTSVLAASVSKASTTSIGGLVFYIGKHDFSTNRADHINGIRMYMNAFLTPSILSCSMSLLPFELNRFTASKKLHAAEINWAVTANEDINHFELFGSRNGHSFQPLDTVKATNRNGYTHYNYMDSTCTNAPAYYRLKIFSQDGNVRYSKTIYINPVDKKESRINILENPVAQHLSFNYMSGSPGPLEIRIYNSGGIQLYSIDREVSKGNNHFSITLEKLAGNGIFYIAVVNGKEQVISKFIKR